MRPIAALSLGHKKVAMVSALRSGPLHRSRSVSQSQGVPRSFVSGKKQPEKARGLRLGWRFCSYFRYLFRWCCVRLS